MKHYQELIQRFWDLNQKKHLGCNAIAMYLYLLKLGNDNKGYDIIVSDVDVSKVLGLARNTIKQTKEKLGSIGLIQYKNKKGRACFYQLLTDYDVEISESEKAQKVKTRKKINPSIVKKDENASSVVVPIENTEEITVQQSEPLPVNPSKYHFKAADIPSLEEFIAFAQTLEGYETSLDSEIEKKYLSWVGNHWRSVSDRPITNWKSSLKNTFPYMINKTDDNTMRIDSIPDIKRPKSSDPKK